MYGIDIETENGFPEKVTKLDDLIISLAEHNGSYFTAFKNAYDWLSRINQKVWKNKLMLLMVTLPGARGGASVLGSAKASFPYLGGNIIADFSLPSFHDNSSENGIVNQELSADLN